MWMGCRPPALYSSASSAFVELEILYERLGVESAIESQFGERIDDCNVPAIDHRAVGEVMEGH